MANQIPFSVVGLFKNKVVIIDEYSENKILAVGETTESGFELVSANSHNAIFKDPQGNLIRSGLSNDISVKFNQVAEIIEFISLNEKNQYITNIIINDNQKLIPAIIDTGANLVTLSGNTATALGISYQNNANRVNVNTASEDVIGFKVHLKSMQLGEILLENIDALVLEGNDPELILVGMSFLKLLELKYAGNKLELKMPNNQNPS